MGFIEQQEELKGKTMGAIAYPMFISRWYDRRFYSFGFLRS
ncbi:MAG: hypothetical protein U0905_15700 [Pirellulales bacterium]